MTQDPLSADPDWLIWAREVQAIAQTGLTFAQEPYDIERYRALSALAARIAAERGGAGPSMVAGLFAEQTGYATPKIGVRGAVFDTSGRILMVRETMDDHRWSLPGGWAEVNQTPSHSVEREVFEESGYRVRAVKLAAVWDRARQAYPPTPFSVVRMFFVCEVLGGEARTSVETSEVGWFAEDALPADLSTGRIQPRHLSRMFAHWRDPGLPTEFD